MKAILMDTTLCMGCRGCQVACKQWNNLPAQETTFFGGAGYQNPDHRYANTWNLVTFNDVQTKNGYDWVFGKRQCFHCNDPACVAACPVGALTKTEAGPVVYDSSHCLGCRYCMVACPFDTPRFEWDKRVPEITKCTMCADRIAEQRRPACVETCPTGALAFGDRDALLKEAEARIAAQPDLYVDHIYGQNEVGGTCLFHLASEPFENIGYRSGLPTAPYHDQIKTAMDSIPFTMTGMTAVLGGLAWIINRRMDAQSEENEKDT